IETNPVPRLAAEALFGAYDRYSDEFRRLVRRARANFETGDWQSLHAASEDRLLLYPRRVAEVVVELARLSLWHPIPPDRVKNRFAAAVENRPDAEIAKTFYNSAIRRLFGTQGVDHQNEFVDLSTPRLDETGVGNRLVGGNASEAELVVGAAM